MSSYGPGAHRYTPTTRTHRPVQRGRHRMMDRQRAGLRQLRVASAAVMLIMSLIGHFGGRPRAGRPSPRRV